MSSPFRIEGHPVHRRFWRIMGPAPVGDGEVEVFGPADIGTCIRRRPIEEARYAAIMAEQDDADPDRTKSNADDNDQAAD